MMSIGYNPTFEAKVQTLEVNILDFDRDIYGENITVYFDTFIRLEKKFNSLHDLISAIQQDEKTTRQIIALKT
jgi:riboflavin kinase/FMN adenylyltransferase